MNLQPFTFHLHRFIALAALLLACCITPAAHAQGGVLLRAKPTTNNIAVNAISNYIAIELPMLGTNSTQLISIADLVTNVFPSLGVGSGGGLSARVDNLEGATNGLNALVQTKQHGTAGLTNFAASLTNRIFLNGASNAPVAISNMPNNSVIYLGADTWNITASKVISNGLAAINLFNKTNVAIIGVPGLSILSGRAAIGELLFMTNCENVYISGVTFDGLVVTNFVSVGAIGHVWGAIATYNVRDFTFENNRVINHHDHGIHDLGAQVNWTSASTNNIKILNNYWYNIGSSRTNESAPYDGAAIVPLGRGWTIRGNTANEVFRFVEPYSEGDAAPNLGFGTVIADNVAFNTLDFFAGTAGNTNCHFITVENNTMINDYGFTRRGTNIHNDAIAINWNGGNGWKIKNNSIMGRWSVGIQASSSVRDGLIEGNHIHDLTNNVGSAVPIQAGVTYNVDIRDNTIYRSENQGIYLFGFRDGTVEGNTIVDTAAGLGIRLLTSGGTVTSNATIRANRIKVSTVGIQDLSGGLENIALVDNVIEEASTKVSNSSGAEVDIWNRDSGDTNSFARIRDLSGVSGTNNPILFSGGTLTLIANQTSRHKHSTNASFAFSISGASNQSSKVFAELQNTSTNTIYATNATGVYDVALASNVTVIPIAGSSTLLIDAYLSVSNNWVADIRGAAYALEFSNGTTATNHTTKTVTYTAPSGGSGGGAGSFAANANQFDTNDVFSLKSGALATNLSARGLTIPSITASRVAVVNSSGNVTNSQAVDLTEIEYLDGVTGAIQTQLSNITNGTARIANTNEVNVRDWGAVGDNVTDDAAAFNAAGTNHNVYVPSGTYRIASALFKTNGTMRGDGISSILRQDFDGILINTYARTQSVSFVGLHLNGGGASTYTNAASGSPARIGLSIQSRGEIKVEGCHFRNYNAQALFAYADQVTTSLRDSKLLIQGNWFSNCWSGITLSGQSAEYSRVIGNYTDFCGYGIQAGSANHIITANHLVDGHVGILVTADATRGHNTIFGNTFNHNGIAGIFGTGTGMTITANEGMGNGLLIFTNASGIRFANNLCELTELRFNGGGFNMVVDNTSVTTPTVVHNHGGNASRTMLRNNYTTGGALWPALPTLSLVAGAAVTNHTDKIKVVGSGGAVTLTSTPSVPTNNVPDGWVIRIVGTDNTNTLTVQDDGTLANSDLSLGASTRALGVGDVLTLQYDATLNQWFEIGWSDN